MEINTTNELINYKIGYKIKRLLKNKNHPNIIIKGCRKCGKTLLIKTIFKELYGNTKIINYDSYYFLEVFCIHRQFLL